MDHPPVRPSDRPRPSRRTLFTGAAALSVMSGGLIAGGLASCQRSEAPVDETGRVRLRVALDGPAGVEHAGYYQALSSGAYERRGLTVHLIPGAPDANVPQLLAAGSVELALSNSSFMAMNLVAEGAPVRAVAAFFQKDPKILLVRPSEDLTTVEAMAGHPFILTLTERAGVWTWLKTQYGFDDSQLRDGSGGLAAFLDDPRAVMAGDLVRTPQQIQQAGRFTPRTFLLADQGYPSYGGVILAPNSFARDNAGALRSFIAASAEGWRDYIQGEAIGPEQRAAEALIRRDTPALDPALLASGRAALKSNAVITGGDAALYGLGAMTPERWQAFFEAGRDAGVYPPNLDWRQAFTRQYLPARQ